MHWVDPASNDPQNLSYRVQASKTSQPASMDNLALSPGASTVNHPVDSMDSSLVGSTVSSQELSQDSSQEDSMDSSLAGSTVNSRGDSMDSSLAGNTVNSQDSSPGGSMGSSLGDSTDSNLGASTANNLAVSMANNQAASMDSSQAVNLEPLVASLAVLVWARLAPILCATGCSKSSKFRGCRWASRLTHCCFLLLHVGRPAQLRVS